VSVVVRDARPTDSALIVDLVRELAEYEKLGSEMDATPNMIAAALFGKEPRVFCDIAEWDGVPAGFAVWFYNFSTSAAVTAFISKTYLCGKPTVIGE